MSRRTTVRHYDAAHLRQIALPIGGIGTGTVSLGGRGDLRDWEIGNRPAKGFRPETAVACVRVQSPGAAPILRALEGPLEHSDYQGPYGSVAPHHGLPRFREASFDAAYPFGTVTLRDATLPITVELTGFNPLTPPDPDDSGIPIAVLSYTFTNTTDQPLAVDFVYALQNFIGSSPVGGAYGSSIVNNFFSASEAELAPRRNRNTYRTGDRLHGIAYEPAPALAGTEFAGTLALALLDAEDVTYRTGWADYTWGDSLLDFWDDFSADGRLDERQSAALQPVGALTTHLSLGAGQSGSVTLLISWHFPHRKAWRSEEYGAMHFGEYTDANVGNHYTQRFTDAWDVLVRTVPRLAELTDRTHEFVDALARSTLPQPLIEAALFNISTLRSQTVFRTADGYLFGWEGTDNTRGSCFGSCTHVWNYEQATPFLFGSLAQLQRETEFLHATRADGFMSFRIGLPLTNAQAWPTAAADGQMGTIVKLFREWRLSGDTNWMARLYPHAKAALAFAWIPNGWDGDRDGVMEGCQHNTMDVEYYGPNPQMQFWYLAALRAAEEMARAVDDKDFARECWRLYKAGRDWTQSDLYNGEYYRHEIRPAHSAANIAPGIRHMVMGAADLSNPELQLGDGCLVDQLVGQFLASVSGLGDLVAPTQLKTTAASIFRYNRKTDFSDHFNHMRSFVLGDESALLMATYPRGNRPARPFPYFNEVMTGFEYTAAANMVYAGLRAEALQVVTDIRARYDGAKRNPFDEAECGHHYARAMASFGVLLAWTGQLYNAHSGELFFDPLAVGESVFWATGHAWGTLDRRRHEYVLTIYAGTLFLSRLVVGDDEIVAYGVVQTLGRSAHAYAG